MKVYLDHNSTTPVDGRVVEAMMPYLTGEFGNPSSAHSLGAMAFRAIENARHQVAELVGADAQAVTFCSSATEAINTVFSMVERGTVVTTVVEHAATLRAAERLEQAGLTVVRLPVNEHGQLSLDDLDRALQQDTALVSLLWANNETGAVFPIEAITSLCSSRGVHLHVDAAQAAGKLPVSLRDVPIDFLSVSAHKINGPKGSAALVMNGLTAISPLLVGGQQERGRRAGTENVPAIVGFGAAASLALNELSERARKVRKLRDSFESEILRRVQGSWVNAQQGPRLANTSNIGITGIDGDELVAALDACGICVSTGSACHAQSTEPSHVIRAMTGSYDAARSSIRFSLSHMTTEAELAYAVTSVVAEVGTIRAAR